ncbi:MAG TPA: prolipoprotein diacylglyceryl transferase [Candidatus Limnocylindrales bacterium]|nr:prolipoprotein diacylglyceryl transferase [Candidatus Limnocylindrales bacterium]
MIRITPDPIAISLGPLSVGWYGIGYVVAVAVLVLVTQREAARRGIDPQHVTGVLVLSAALAIIGARLYHVIDQFHLYSSNLAAIVLPPYSGLGLYGGVAGAALGIAIYTRRHGIPVWRALDVVIPGTLFAQGIARWGNFFNQELYGPPTSAPWGIAIECQNRVALYPCDRFPFETTGFHPLFFYESALTITGGLIALWLARRFAHRLRDGDIASFWGIWYGAVRTFLETFREGYNWTVGGIPTAQLIGIGLIVVGIATIVWRHTRSSPIEPEQPEEASERQSPVPAGPSG